MQNSAAKYLFIAILIVSTIVLVQTLPAGGCGRRDSKPPKIHYVLQYPLEPEYEDSVLVLAYITDSKSGVANATLRYTVNGQQTINVGMNKNCSLYFAEIPPLSYNSTVTYAVLAYDKAGNKACSKEYVYTVGDFHPPTITFIQQTPTKPNYNETVIIVANATEPANASGVEMLILSYDYGAGWENVSMELNGAFYSTVIPKSPFGSTVRYRVCAVDKAGNTAVFDIYSYEVADQYLPIAAITTPKNGSFLSKSVNITLYAYDDNFHEAKLKIDSKILASWNQTGTSTYVLNTAVLSEGIHKLTLEALDKAGNKAEHTVFVTVDNTAPMAEIEWPIEGSYISGLALVRLRAEDANFERLELKIGEFTSIWKEKDQTYVWNTTDFSDGKHQITLTALDKAGNKAEKRITVTVDNTEPTISGLTWSPEAPAENETVKVSAQIADNLSGIKDALLWFRRLDGGEWQKTPMIVENGNWTATIPGFEENAIIVFYVECSDKAGNLARSIENYYVVKAIAAGGFTGIPLHWLVLAVLAIFVVLASTAYYLKRRKRGAAATTFLVSSL